MNTTTFASRSTAIWRTPLQLLAGAAALALLLSACASLRVGHDYDRSAQFSGYHRFALMSRDHGSLNPLAVRHASDAIQAELTRKGFVLVAEEAMADFVVDFTIGYRERMDVTSYPAPYLGFHGRHGWWGYPYWGNEIDVHMYREGTLSIDIFDARTRVPVWHGWAKKELTPSDVTHSEEPIRAAVQAMIAAFPPKP